MINNRFNVVYHLLGLVKLLFYRLKKNGNMENLNELREKIYKQQFWEYDYDNGCEKANEVLESLEKIKQNPVLLDYVLKCLVSNEIEIKEYFYLIVHQEHRTKIYDVVIDKIFNSIEEAEDYARNGSFTESLLFEKYSVKSINSKQ
jgi:IS30 family transposase